MSELKFASTEEALQYLADVSGKKVMIAGYSTKMIEDDGEEADENGYSGYSGLVARVEEILDAGPEGDEKKAFADVVGKALHLAYHQQIRNAIKKAFKFVPADVIKKRKLNEKDAFNHHVVTENAQYYSNDMINQIVDAVIARMFGHSSE
jgi:ribosomal protein S17E